MAVTGQLRFKIFLFVCGEVTFVFGQYNQFGYPNYNQENPYSQNNPYPYDNGYNNPYNNPNPYNIPNPGDRDYRTYLYKGRRYGQPPSFYNDKWRPGNPQIQGQDEHYFYDPVCKQNYLNQVINFMFTNLSKGMENQFFQEFWQAGDQIYKENLDHKQKIEKKMFLSKLLMVKCKDFWCSYLTILIRILSIDQDQNFLKRNKALQKYILEYPMLNHQL